MTSPGEEEIAEKVTVTLLDESGRVSEILRFTGELIVSLITEAGYDKEYAKRFSLYKTPKGYRVYVEELNFFAGAETGFVHHAMLLPFTVDSQTGNREYSDYSMEEMIGQWPLFKEADRATKDRPPIRDID
jgi:hypothetical protein